MCYLLALPSEIRNSIYEMIVHILSENDNSRRNFDSLPYPTGPNLDPSLLLTCRLIYTEAHGIFKQANETYWATTHFQLSLVADQRVQRKRLKSTLRELKDRDVANITHLTIYCGKGSVFSPWLEFTNGVWNYICSDCGRGTFRHHPRHAVMTKSDLKDVIKALPQAQRWKYSSFSRVVSGEWLEWVVTDVWWDEEEIENVKRAAGWGALTKREIIGMLHWTPPGR